MTLGVLEWGVALAGFALAVAVAIVVMRLVRQIVSGCVSAGLGCLALVICLLVLGAVFASLFEIPQLQGLMDVFSAL